MEIKRNEVMNMYKQTEKLPGLDLYVNLNFERLSKEDQAIYVLAAEEYMSKLQNLWKKLGATDETVMCHEIIFNTEEIFDPYDARWLKEYPLYLTKYEYAPVPTSWLGIKVRELNKWMQVYIPDPNGIISKDMAVEMAVTEAQDWIAESMKIYNQWEEIRKKF